MRRKSFIALFAAVTLFAVAMPGSVKSQGFGISTDTHELRGSTNLLHWLTLTPDIGFEYRYNQRIGLAVHGSSTFGKWHLGNSRWGIWRTSVEGRYYMGEERNWYAGAAFNTGSANWYAASNNIGRQIDFKTYNVTGGYILNLTDDLMLDFNIGFGFDDFTNYQRYYKVGDNFYEHSKTNHTAWFFGHLGANLTWRL